MESFEGDQQDFEMDTLRDREPVELVQDRCDVFTRAGVGEEAGSGVLNVLQLHESFGWCTVKNAIAIVDSGCNKGMN